jgi:hypothetical protein
MFEGAQYCKIPKSIWNKDQFRALNNAAKLVLFHLFSTTYANPIGLYKITPDALATEIGIPADDYLTAFYSIQDHGWFDYDPKYQLVFNIYHIEANKPENGKTLIKRAWLGAYNDLPDCQFKERWLATLYECAAKWDAGKSKKKETFLEYCERYGPNPFSAQSPNSLKSAREEYGYE